MQIALDAMGGDHAPGPIVAGAVQAVAADPDLRLVLASIRTSGAGHRAIKPEAYSRLW